MGHTPSEQTQSSKTKTWTVKTPNVRRDQQRKVLKMHPWMNLLLNKTLFPLQLHRVFHVNASSLPHVPALLINPKLKAHLSNIPSGEEEARWQGCVTSFPPKFKTLAPARLCNLRKASMELPKDHERRNVMFIKKF